MNTSFRRITTGFFSVLAEDREGLASSILKDRDAASVTELGLERVRVETEE